MMNLAALALSAMVALNAGFSGVNVDFANTGNGETLQSAKKTYVCSVKNCYETKEHGHDICSIADCTETGSHEHGGVIFYGHHDNDGHGHNVSNSINTQPEKTVEVYNCGISLCGRTEEHSHALCSVSGCTLETNHAHGEMIYYGHSSDDGHGYHGCGISGCTNSESHSHNKGNGGNHKSGHNRGGHH